jgi:hypothetical protein
MVVLSGNGAKKTKEKAQTEAVGDDEVSWLTLGRGMRGEIAEFGGAHCNCQEMDGPLLRRPITVFGRLVISGCHLQQRCGVGGSGSLQVEGTVYKEAAFPHRDKAHSKYIVRRTSRLLFGDSRMMQQ